MYESFFDSVYDCFYYLILYKSIEKERRGDIFTKIQNILHFYFDIYEHM